MVLQPSPAGPELGQVAEHSFPTRRPLWCLSDSDSINSREQHSVIIRTTSQSTFLSRSCFPFLSKLSAYYLGMLL